MLAAHTRIAHLFGTARGLHYMFLDSEIMVAALLQLAEHDIVGLPLQDGLLCRSSVAGVVEGIMTECSKHIAAVELPVSIKHPQVPS